MKQSAMEIIKRIRSLGKFEALMVGGCVRDMLMGIEPSDYDIATNCPINIIESVFKCHDIGKNKDFGIVVVEYNGFNFEIAQFRRESGSLDSRHPDNVEFVNTFAVDAARRDFTINSMGIDEENNVIDPFNGLDDMKHRLIRCVGNPIDRFNEDHLRILRAIRFSATFDFKIEFETRKAIYEMGDKIVAVSPERIKQELFKVASKGGVVMARFIKLLRTMDLLKYVLPEINIMDECEHTITSHPEGNVFVHTLKALEACEHTDPLIVLGVLFHDIGKPPSKHYNDEGAVRYSGHDQGKYIEPLAERLKFSNEEIDYFKYIIEHHMMVFALPDLKKTRAIPLVEHKHFDSLMKVIYCDTFCNGRGRIEKIEQYDQIADTAKKLLETKEPERVTKLKKAINGKWIMDKFGLKEGKEIGRLKNAGQSFAIENNLCFETEEDKEILLENVYKYLKTYFLD